MDSALPPTADQSESNGARRQIGERGAPAGRTPWHRRLAFWRAVAGMAAAVALASVVVMVETSADLTTRSAAFHRRLAHISGRLAQARARLRDEDRELLAMHREAVVRDTLNAILSEPDAQLIQLTGESVGSAASGIVVASRIAGRAVVEVSGLPPLDERREYALWLRPMKGNPMKAAEFRVDEKGRAALKAAPPTDNAAITDAFVTVEAQPSPALPGGPVALRGRRQKTAGG